MHLLDLPPEVFGLVIAHLVTGAGILQAWQHRKVSRTFRRSIEFETLANQPTRAFLQLKEASARGILKRNMALYLSYRISALKGAYSFLPRFMKKVCDTVNAVLPESDYQTQRHNERVLCKLLVERRPDAQALLMTKTPESSTKFTNNIHDFDDDVSSNYIAAAAAVGNLQALRTALNDDLHMIFKRSPAFGYPLAAAAAGHHFEIVRAIVKHFEQSQEQIHMDYVDDQFKAAINAAFETECNDATLLLLQILNEYGAPLGDNQLSSWTSKAVNTRNSKIIRLVLRLRRRQTGEFAFKHACNSGDIKALRMFIREGLVHLHCSYSYNRCYTPIHMAASSGKLNVVKELLKLGANPNGCFVRHEPKRPLWIAIAKNHENVVRVLLQHGANPEFILSYWYKQADHFKDSRAAIEVLLIEAKRKQNYYVPPTTPRTHFAADAADLTTSTKKEEGTSVQMESLYGSDSEAFV